MSNKIIAYTALHYGRDYLAYAIQSIIDYVEEYHVLYSAIGSHGHRTAIPCPETRDELYAIASVVAGHKLRWHDGEWAHEGLQRDSIYQYAPDAAMIISLDADEIWQHSLIKSVMDYAFTVTSSIPPFRYMRVPFIHYWRSFHRAVMHDPAYPVRVIFPQINEKYGTETYGRGVINHMGYAQRPEIVEYKILTHGHKNEWRHDVDWFKDKYLANAQIDTHPVGSEYWNPEDIDYRDYMPRFMAYHPYAKMDVIE